ncbi:MAG: ribosome small subunit-dependent GTPase A [Brevinema sp.]
MNKFDFGWNNFYDQWFSKVTYYPARVTRKHNSGYEVVTDKGFFYARLRGRIRKEIPKGQWPAVGDWVGVSFQDDYVMIEVLAPRLSKISRKVSGKTTDEQIIAANADILCIVVSLKLDYNPRKIERYLALCSESGAAPVIILNKVDLVDDLDKFMTEIHSIAPDVPVHFTNALNPETLIPLHEYTKKGHTVVLLGSSGAGKSTIVNQLTGNRTQMVREIGKNNKGVHTTSSRDMLFLKDGGIIIDNPGIRELRVWLEGDEAIQDTFADIEEMSKQCRFRNCQHLSEPECAVLNGVKDGVITADRLENWRKITMETSELLIKRQENRKKPPQGFAQAYKQLKKSGRKGLR